MRTKRAFYLGATALGVAGFLAAYQPLSAQNTVAIDADDIGGVVTSSKGPEAGVWVIAETTDLGTNQFQGTGSRRVGHRRDHRPRHQDVPVGRY